MPGVHISNQYAESESKTMEKGDRGDETAIRRGEENPLLIRRPNRGGEGGGGSYEFSFRGRTVRIGRCLEESDGLSSHVFYLHEVQGTRLPFIIRFTPSKAMWDREGNGLSNQNRAAEACANILSVESYGMYEVHGESTSSPGRISPFPDIMTCGLFAILPLCHGGDMFHLATNRKILATVPAEYIVDVCKSLVRSLRGLSDQGVIHGDIKPENICFRRRTGGTGVPFASTLALIDFGFSALDKSGIGILHSCGTYAYIAPEVYDNRRCLRGNPCTGAIDMFGAGASLYILCNEWLRARHHENTAYPGKSEYDMYLRKMDNYSPRERDAAYKSSQEELSLYKSFFPKDRDGIVVVDVINYVVAAMTMYDACDRPTPSQVMSIFETEIQVYDDTYRIREIKKAASGRPKPRAGGEWGD